MKSFTFFKGYAKLYLFLTFFITYGNVYSQDIPVTGRVTADFNGEPLPGVNVLIKGTSEGTITDVDGSYRLDVPQEAILVFSFIGFVSEEIPVNGRSVVDISLLEDIQSLSEVVVVGYGTQKRTDLTGAISSVKGEEIENLPVRSVAEAIQGRAAGVMVTKNSGRPGESANIIIRGPSSINATRPLYIVDGIRQPAGNGFNIQDVESIEVLKDASAAAIYGAQAANGVILITTKRGKSGAMRVDLNASVGQREALGLPDLLGRDDYIALKTQARLADNPDASIDPTWANPSVLPNTDWTDEIYGGNGMQQRYNLSLSGGSDKSNYFISGGYERENGVMILNSFERYSLRSNNEFSINSRLKVGTNIYLFRTEEDPTAEAGRDIERIYRSTPLMAIRDVDNNLGGWAKAPSGFAGPNSVAIEHQNHRFDTENALNGLFFAELEPLDGLKLRANLGANISQSNNLYFREAYDYGPLTGVSALERKKDNRQQLTGNFTATYAKAIGKHEFTIMAGYEAIKSEGDDLRAYAENFATPYSESFSLSTQAEAERSVSGNPNYGRILSQFGRLTYSYAGKYLFTGNIRRDGSDRFGESNRYGVFPSFSAGWRISEEDFMQSIAAITNLKIRGSWGVLGSDAIGQYLNQQGYTNNKSIYVFGNTNYSGFYNNRFANQNIKWEEVTQTDIGFELGLFNKISLSVDLYDKQTTDMLFRKTIPSSSGISELSGSPNQVPENIGAVSNKGLEIAAGFQDEIGSLNFSINGNIAFNKNEVLNLNDEIINEWSSRTQEGYPMAQFYGHVVEGIFQTDDQVAEYNEGSPTGVYDRGGTTKGDFIFKDIDGTRDPLTGELTGVPDGRINDDDRVIIGNPFPKSIFGLSVNADYKGIDLTLFFQGTYGGEILNELRQYNENFRNDYNSTNDARNGWTQERPTDQPRLSAADPSSNYRTSTYLIEDGSYIKLRNLQIGYSFPATLINSVGLSNARIYASGQNLLTFTKYTGLDPEVGGTADNNQRRGVEGLGSYPQTRLISIGIELGF